ncbi:phytanoyl-CoA dioxygenase family protein [Microlunatus elymi]|uniref:Phytanoyl-CoA dioxygenase family protein n=1 Tax=Microlunatus elymi TaxID=2596828 RepID=A0A516PU35_9ACTN|nr:phytanoyl-CoA dioxygenase family protein [Microlunatus elymi]QDP94640.1 phytanoyl-CoA dioxygenase family protein [Microlunatus elymi]
MKYEVLDSHQREQFLEQGFVRIPDCFSRKAAAEYTSWIWTRLGYRSDDQSTWAESSIHMPTHRTIDVKSFAPKAWQAACELVGGADRVKEPYTWGDGFIVNLWEGADTPWEDASATSPGWHKDGDFFRHFLDSPEQGLLTLVLWSDVQHQGGATFVATDSVGHVANFLADHPEGVGPGAFSQARLIDQCSHFAEATGEIGTVYLLHPYILHAKAQNVTRTPRYITNPPIHLNAPMRFDREQFSDHSLVEQAVLRALGTERYHFEPTQPRESIVPARVKAQRERKQAEDLRLNTSYN